MTSAETVKGELTSFRVLAGDFWGRGTVRTRHDGGEITVVGKLIGANVGDTIECDGHFENSKYGHQFKLRGYRVVLPSDVRGVVGWLAAKLPQISARRAEDLVTRFGVDGLWAMLDRGDEQTVSDLCTVDGINGKRAAEIIAAYKQHRDSRDRLVRLKGWGLTDNQADRVIKEWGEDAEKKLIDNPYQLIEFVSGFGWERADSVAMRMGVQRSDRARVAAALLHEMKDTITGAGHCYAPMGKLVAVTAKKTLGIADEQLVRSVLAELVTRGKLAQLDQNVYLPQIAQAEGELAAEFAKRTADNDQDKGAA